MKQYTLPVISLSDQPIGHIVIAAKDEEEARNIALSAINHTASQLTTLIRDPRPCEDCQHFRRLGQPHRGNHFRCTWGSSNQVSALFVEAERYCCNETQGRKSATFFNELPRYCPTQLPLLKQTP